MREEFLHYVWQFGLFNRNALQTSDGRDVVVLNSGAHNAHAGPDFFNARLVIGGTTWVGNVEIHVDEKDWYRHEHQKDAAYNNVILHVVYAGEGNTITLSGESIPVLILSGRIEEKQYRRYLSFLASRTYIPCASRFKEADSVTVSSCLERMLISRLERKSGEVLKRLDANRGDWQQTLFEQLAVSFGFKTNAEPMEMLARTIPVNLLAKYQHSRITIEALLFGQSGLLSDSLSDPWPQTLQNEYAFLSKKHGLIPLDPVVWKFGRMRPANFPTIRIGQLAGLIHQSKGLFQAIVDFSDPAVFTRLFDVEAGTYWESHHRFDQLSARISPKRLGNNSVDNLIINTVVPFLFAYSKHVDNQHYLEKGLLLLESRPPEENSVVKHMNEIGFRIFNAAGSQAALELKSKFCDKKKCLNCAIGNQLLKSATSD